MLRLVFSTVVVACLVLCAACGCNSKEPNGSKPLKKAVSPIAESATSKGPHHDPKGGAFPRGDTLFSLTESAYSTSLFIQGDEVLLLTQAAVIRLVDGEPARTHALPLGPGPTLAGDSIIYFRNG